MSNNKVAYFSAEIGLNSVLKTYSGGLGILAGDTIKAMADLKFPLCAVTLLYKKGFLKQKIIDGLQHEEEDDWDFMDILENTQKEVSVEINGEEIFIKIWKYIYKSHTGGEVPIYFLDTDIDKNPLWAQSITNKLYQGNRLYQEIVLGIGGVRALKEIGEDSIEKYHMNEGHSAFLTLELYNKLGESINWDINEIKKMCVFTTHTPIPAGHDKFKYEDIHTALGENSPLIPWQIETLAGYELLNTTQLAMSFSGYINAVSRKHQEVSKHMFPDFNINYITNGVHALSWVGEHMRTLFDTHIEGWRDNNSLLSKIEHIPGNEIISAHLKQKHDLIDYVNKHNIVEGVELKKDILTIGFARRFIEYKDADMIFKNLDLLRSLKGKVQFVFAGKSHAHDGVGKSIMKKVIEYARGLKDEVSIAFLENYNMDMAKYLISGCDLWLNTPIPPNEASGTSGMKAALNGCLHFSTLDGWAIESFEINGGGYPIINYDDFFATLKYKIIPKFYCDTASWAQEMKLAIGHSGAYFNTHRMAREYILKGYKLDL